MTPSQEVLSVAQLITCHTSINQKGHKKQEIPRNLLMPVVLLNRNNHPEYAPYSGNLVEAYLLQCVATN